MRPPAAPRRWLSILLVGVPAAFIVAVFAAVTIVPFLLRWESFIVTSASMTPTIPVGSVVVVDPSVAQKMQVGDIGTFNQVESQMRVTHRVIEVQGPEGPNRVYITKGDATRTTDGPRAANTAIGRVQYTVPWVGYVATSVNEPQIRYPLIGLIVVLIGISYFRSR
ncbi:MAG: signal peptidase I, partial [Proteobacteria bacterium]|nr:signal peptidase I [Pseudomonadota bacterium]